MNVLGDCKIKLYADDTVNHQSDVNHAAAAHRLQNKLNWFYIWCLENKLTINTKKN